MNNQFRRLPLAALRTFEVAARLQSFKLAAQELSVTPTTVSNQIRKLEREPMKPGEYLDQVGQQVLVSAPEVKPEPAEVSAS